ncbi:hypothetical protein BOC36_18675 [Burkholderia pseudomallei]|nr:hypothetical protein BOC36_18675 [Burkholderia pseudomallei]
MLGIEKGTTSTGDPCVHVYYVPMDDASGEAGEATPSATFQRVLLATVTDRLLRTRPIQTWRDKHDYLEPKYGSLVCIAIEADDFGWRLPEEPDDFIGLLESLPQGFNTDFRFGLGLHRDLRFIVEEVSAIPGITELIITAGNVGSIDEPYYRLGVDRFDQLRRGINTIGRRQQSDALVDKRLLAYASLRHGAAPDKYPPKSKPVRPGALYELVKVGPERPAYSPQDRKAAVRLVKQEKEEIAKSDPAELLALKVDIERVTLATLIKTFEDMLAKDLPEARWQEFLKANPFILSLAFAYPIFVVQDQAYVGGASIRGGGEKIADFLAAQRYTGNLALIEIKKPKTPLLAPYRTDLLCAAKETSGAISQVLDQRFRLQTSFTQKAYESGLTGVHPYAIQCIVIAGTSPSDPAERKSLELFRHASKDVIVITFDELLGKLKEIQMVFAVSDEATPAEA